MLKLPGQFHFNSTQFIAITLNLIAVISCNCSNIELQFLKESIAITIPQKYTVYVSQIITIFPKINSSEISR